MLIKLIGCVFVIGTTSAIGFGKGMEYKRHVDELDRLKRVIWHLKGEINYTRNSLQEICQQVAKRVENPYENWLLSLAEQIEEKGHSNLGKLWENAALAYLKDTDLKKEDVEELASLGYQLGYFDVTRQEETLKWYAARLEEKRNALADKLEERRKLCSTLGVMSGIFLAILLI